MKKILFLATLVACSLLFLGCETKTVDANETAIAKVKADAMGSWEGEIIPILGTETRWVTVTFTETKVTTSEDVSANITAWKCVDGKDVWVELDDAFDDEKEKHSALHIAVSGDKMTLGFNSSFGLSNFPAELTRKK